jgi:hypothetical protein
VKGKEEGGRKNFGQAQRYLQNSGTREVLPGQSARIYYLDGAIIAGLMAE